jgi:drug/metabolite transporter (DMT)-like permease
MKAKMGVNPLTDLNWPVISIIIGGVLIAVLAVYLFKIRRELMSGFPLKDERTERISGKAAMGTYYVTLLFVVIMELWITFGDEVSILPEIETGYILIAVMLVMGFSFGVLNWLYARREGRVEDSD